MRVALAIVAAFVLVGCGGAHAKKLSFVPVAVPAFPNAAAPRVTVQPQFQSTDWTLPANIQASVVYDWYTSQLSARGWKITQRNETGLHAVRGKRTLDVGVRGRTLEVNQG